MLLSKQHDQTVGISLLSRVSFPNSLSAKASTHLLLAPLTRLCFAHFDKQRTKRHDCSGYPPILTQSQNKTIRPPLSDCYTVVTRVGTGLRQQVECSVNLEPVYNRNLLNHPACGIKATDGNLNRFQWGGKGRIGM